MAFEVKERQYKGPGGPDETSDFPYTKYDDQLIRDSIITIILTEVGQRLFVPDFGCGITKVLFDPNDNITADQVSTRIRSALRVWEPRVKVLSVKVKSTEEVLDILVICVIKRLVKTIRVPISVDRASLSNIGA